jgi:hypothetical protein
MPNEDGNHSSMAQAKKTDLTLGKGVNQAKSQYLTTRLGLVQSGIYNQGFGTRGLERQ